MRFSNTLLLALSAVAVQSAVVPTNQQTTTAAATQAQPTPQLTAEAQCVINNNCNQDVSCIAKCYNVPAPTDDMVYKTNDCASKCPDATKDSAGYLKCYNDCVDNFYMGNNVNASTGANNNVANGNTQNGQNTTANNTNAPNGQNNVNTPNGQNNANGNQNGNTSGNELKPVTNTTNTINNGNNNNSSSSATTMKVSAFAIGAAALAFLF